jgi:hypothetical protein
MLYHKETGLPDVSIPNRFLLRPTFHAKKAAETDRYGKFDIPGAVFFCKDDIVELEVYQNAVVKILLRVPYNGEFDLCLAVIPLGKWAKVKTAWLNRKDDNHQTLDASRYNRP